MENYQEVLRHMRLRSIKVTEIPGVAMEVAKKIEASKQFQERQRVDGGENFVPEEERLFKAV